jgi:hypothetical protein
MANPRRTLTFTLVMAVALMVGAAAQAPRMQNARVTPQPAANLQQTFRSLVAAQTEPAWIGYAVPVIDGERTMCCFDSGSTWISGNVVMSDGSACCGMCSLEQGGGTSMTTRTAPPASGPIKLEGSGLMTVLFRIENRAVERVRVFSEDCALDAGGRQLTWLENVSPADSVALLASLATAETERKSRVASGAMSAIGLHKDASADATLISLAKTHPVSSVRSDAIFWLGQKAGMKAAGAITERIDNDPETDVKKRAVFALSQMPRNEGVPLLINVARTHSNPAVRKQAMFWLGQSKDPRAIDFFAEVLSK